MLDFTNEEKAYILEMLRVFHSSLIDLEDWEDQDLITPAEIAREKSLIKTIMEKLANEGSN